MPAARTSKMTPKSGGKPRGHSTYYTTSDVTNVKSFILSKSIHLKATFKEKHTHKLQLAIIFKYWGQLTETLADNLYLFLKREPHFTLNISITFTP